jgi:hypothetical protein
MKGYSLVFHFRRVSFGMGIRFFGKKDIFFEITIIFAILFLKAILFSGLYPHTRSETRRAGTAQRKR